MVDRIDPPQTADERTTLNGFLDWYRATLAHKCDGLTPVQLAECSTPPSDLSLLGLVRHMADVERGWFRSAAGEEFSYRYYLPDGPDPDLEFHEAFGEQVVVDDAFAAWQSEVDHAREVVAARSLDDTYVRRGETFSVRWTVVHMIEEYARHCGHADLIRERIDGAKGE